MMWSSLLVSWQEPTCDVELEMLESGEVLLGAGVGGDFDDVDESCRRVGSGHASVVPAGHHRSASRGLRLLLVLPSIARLPIARKYRAQEECTLCALDATDNEWV